MDLARPPCARPGSERDDLCRSFSQRMRAGCRCEPRASISCCPRPRSITSIHAASSSRRSRKLLACCVRGDAWSSPSTIHRIRSTGRWLGRTRWVPFPFGYSPSGPRLREMLADAGLEVIACETLIHNPRIVSTVLFLALRRLLHSRADRAIRGLLAAFEVLERLPTRGLTACFLATCAVRSTMPPHDSSALDVLRT